MAENTGISWCDMTFNPWIGCSKVSPGCANCYAERDFDHRRHVAQWGPNGTRVVTSDANWKQPLKWNKKAAAEPFVCARCGTRYFCESGASPKCDWKCRIVPYRPRVFCASLADVFEDRSDLDAPRARLFELIDATPNLDWLLLTKRPENVPFCWSRSKPPGWFRPNVWIGTSVENMAAAEKRIPELLKVPAPVHFLSCEPLLSPLALKPWLGTVHNDQFDGRRNEGYGPWVSGIEWVIAGGESGPKARTMEPDWVRRIRDDCLAARVPFFFKQWGAVSMGCGLEGNPVHDAGYVVGEKNGGDILDGRQWHEFPEVLSNNA